ncbi:MAG: hypothetical protein J0H85_03255 [Sediminibacterium magnilacihabitans]|jgi:predicted alpha/beta superfamily hydrolase|nr:hypothetical protein [Sediminibacterium magnilacihabitans]PQV62095.1 putative alpha/beta superfamily hydrolase [Sediminibacterium magnilacihabitans]
MDNATKFSICLTDIPLNTPSGDAIYVSGNFNNWQTNDEGYKMKMDEQGVYYVVIDKKPGDIIEFKFTRGSWDRVECDLGGNDLPNYYLILGDESVRFITKVSGWKDITNEKINPGVSIFEHNYFVPQLNKYRRIWVYLPPDYRLNRVQHYPVLYMQDAQNLFKWGISSANGKWNIDHSLNKFFSNGMQGVIAIGIDSADHESINEYCPWVTKQGGGKGNMYIQFITDTLKPDIDKRLRTKPERDNTAIMGSSMGGLISLYAILARQDVFSKAGIFSPALYFADEIYQFAAQTPKQLPVKIALFGGELESESLMKDLLALYNTLRDSDYREDELHFDFYGDGLHQEWFWEREFVHVLTWLFEEEEIKVDDEDMLSIKIRRNGTNTIHLSNPYSGFAKICLINAYGKTVWQQETSAVKQNFNLPEQLNGNMIAKVKLDNGKYLFKKVKL